MDYRNKVISLVRETFPSFAYGFAYGSETYPKERKHDDIETSSTIDVILVEDAESLEEVVVVGYGVQKKTLVTGAGVNVKGEDIAALNTGNAMQALQGTTAGVSITRDNGQPGAPGQDVCAAVC